MSESIPIDTGSMWGNDEASIMSMRWEAKDLIAQLWKNLAYMELTYKDGKAYLTSIIPEGEEQRVKPPINAQGARAIINIVQSVVNPVVSLTKIHQDQALILLSHIKRLTRRLVCIKGKEYGCERRIDKHLVLQIVENICFTQLMRAVNGHESKQARTTYLDRNESGSYTTTSGKSWNPFKNKQGEQM